MSAFYEKTIDRPNVKFGFEEMVTSLVGEGQSDIMPLFIDGDMNQYNLVFEEEKYDAKIDFLANDAHADFHIPHNKLAFHIQNTVGLEFWMVAKREENDDVLLWFACMSREHASNVFISKLLIARNPETGEFETKLKANPKTHKFIASIQGIAMTHFIMALYLIGYFGADVSVVTHNKARNKLRKGRLPLPVVYKVNADGFFDASPQELKAMSQRSFTRTATIVDKKAIPAYEIICGTCGAVEKITANTYGGSMAPEGIAAKFRNRGWEIGRRAGTDVCPSCVKERTSRRPLTPMNPPTMNAPRENKIVSLNTSALKVVAPVDEPVIHAEPPREMSRDDRRVIFAKLQDVYIDEKNGYGAGWSDARVAQDLGVPLAWVRTIRAENFGEEATNAENDALLREARAAVEAGKQMLADHLAAMRSTLKAQDKERKKMSDDLARVEARLGELLKAFGR